MGSGYARCCDPVCSTAPRSSLRTKGWLRWRLDFASGSQPKPETLPFAPARGHSDHRPGYHATQPLVQRPHWDVRRFMGSPKATSAPVSARNLVDSGGPIPWCQHRFLIGTCSGHELAGDHGNLKLFLPTASRCRELVPPPAVIHASCPRSSVYRVVDHDQLQVGPLLPQAGAPLARISIMVQVGRVVDNSGASLISLIRRASRVQSSSLIRPERISGFDFGLRRRQSHDNPGLAPSPARR